VGAVQDDSAWEAARAAHCDAFVAARAADDVGAMAAAALAATGLTTAEIARQLVISPKTADSHIQHIYAKIGCSTRGAAVLFALRHNLVG
jgi:DNA-binding CsgD family transcriptional regulator